MHRKVNRPMGVAKRDPAYFPTLRARFMALSKSDWADAYADLYHQTVQDGADEAAVMADAEKRICILKKEGIR